MSLDVDRMVGALQDRVHIDTGIYRVGRSIRLVVADPRDLKRDKRRRRMARKRRRGWA